MTNRHGEPGTVTRDDHGPTIHFTRRFGFPPDRVWRALTTAEGLMAWLAVTATIDARDGGSVDLRFDEENHVSGTITTFEPTTTLAHTWIINGEARSEVRYDLEADGDGTVLTLTHARLPDEMAAGYAPGWHAYLVRLDAALSGETPPEWMEVFAEVRSAYG